MLAGYHDERIFRIKVVDVIVSRIWKEHYPRIVKFVLLPYLYYAFCFIGYMTFGFKIKDKETKIE